MPLMMQSSSQNDFLLKVSATRLLSRSEYQFSFSLHLGISKLNTCTTFLPMCSSRKYPYPHGWSFDLNTLIPVYLPGFSSLGSTGPTEKLKGGH